MAVSFACTIKNIMMKKIISVLLAFFGILTLITGIYYYANTPLIDKTIRTIMFSLFVADAIFYLAASWGVFKKIRWLFWPTIALLAVNILALVFDDIGWVDLSAGFYNLIIIILLLTSVGKDESRRVA